MDTIDIDLSYTATPTTSLCSAVNAWWVMLSFQTL